ncbi:MAG: glutathione S-transferase [Kangiella sp.]|nr:MAG: glutathione S-transferase [Kangiella sp.]
MTTKHIPELISFNVCPFVQRSAIALIEKNAKFTTTYIDLKNPPDWFADVSPLGKVPVLRIGDAIIFESAVIAEYLDERYAPNLHPTNLISKAHHRSWTEFASDITNNMFMMLYAKTEESFKELQSKIKKQLHQVEQVIDKQGPLFAGEHFSLVDAAYAPVFLRLDLVDQVYKLNLFEYESRLGLWSSELLKRNSVKASVVDDFEEIFFSYNKNSGGYLAEQIALNDQV